MCVHRSIIQAYGLVALYQYGTSLFSHLVFCPVGHSGLGRLADYDPVLPGSFRLARKSDYLRVKGNAIVVINHVMLFISCFCFISCCSVLL